MSSFKLEIQVFQFWEMFWNYFILLMVPSLLFFLALCLWNTGMGDRGERDICC